MVLALQPMAPDAIADFFASTRREYVESLVRAGRSREQADEDADLSQSRAFKDGELLGGNVVFSVADDDQPVGVLWIGPRDASGFWWIYDIAIDEGFRGRGFGRQTMLLAEDAVRERGGDSLGLNVFGDNATARNLYDSLGYQPASIQMRKNLAPSQP